MSDRTCDTSPVSGNGKDWPRDLLLLRQVAATQSFELGQRGECWCCARRRFTWRRAERAPRLGALAGQRGTVCSNACGSACRRRRPAPRRPCEREPPASARWTGSAHSWRLGQVLEETARTKSILAVRQRRDKLPVRVSSKSQEFLDRHDGRGLRAPHLAPERTLHSLEAPFGVAAWRLRNTTSPVGTCTTQISLSLLKLLARRSVR